MKPKKLQVILICIIVITVLIFLYLKISARGGVVAKSPNQVVMNTIGRIIVFAEDKNLANECVKAGFEKIKYVEKMMNRYDANSPISFLNKNAYGNAVKIDDELFEVILRSIEYSQKSDGAFDITVKPLIAFWKNCEKTNTLPNPKQLQAVHKRIGYEKIVFDTSAKTVKFSVDGMSIDLGAIAKGYAIDLALAEIKNKGAYGAMVDIGGDISCFGRSGQNNNWIIGLQDPFNVLAGEKYQNAKILLKLKLTDKAIATSGNYQRYYTINGKRFSHIINPATNTSADELSSVTVIADKAIDADAMATTVSVLGMEKGLEFIEETLGVEAIIITNKKTPTLIKSSGANKYTLKGSKFPR